MIQNAIIRRDVGGECDDEIANCSVQIRQTEADSWPDDTTVVIEAPGTGSAGGDTITTTTTTMTGNAALGQNAGSIVSSGEGKSVFTGSGISSTLLPSGPNNNTGGKTEANGGQGSEGHFVFDPAAGRRLWVEPDEAVKGLFTLYASERGPELTPPAMVSFDYVPEAGETGDAFYVVFREESGKLIAFRATYIPTTGQLRFLAKRLGPFVVGRFRFEGEEFSPDFYKALGKTEEVRKLF